MSIAHIINHTHWDREWFLTEEYTTAWIPELVDAIERLAEENPDYEFLVDGQALVIEDLLRTRPEYRSKVEALVGKGNLSMGPVYSQPDWRMVSGELHLRNLVYGIGDTKALGGSPDVAWLVDTFGHISQAPQILKMSGVDSAYVWRGVPELTPLFRWVGADGTELPTVDLFGGYRNLYGITKTADIAVQRLVAEVTKLRGSYGELPIPLFDGYDLDTDPEDPVRFYGTVDVPEGIDIVASSPRAYVESVLPFLETAPKIEGELLSGKFGSTFPGSLASRAYLKLLHHDAERSMHRYVEPLAAMASLRGVPYEFEAYESVSRELLQNGVHDCLCGVSIDQVHERMERSYRRILRLANERRESLTASLLSGFTTGTYVISTVAMPVRSVVRTSLGAIRVDSESVGVSQVGIVEAVEAVDVAFDPSDERFHLDGRPESFTASGLNNAGGEPLIRLIVHGDSGDTYSSEPGDHLGDLQPLGPLRLTEVSALHRSFSMDLGLSISDRDISATITMTITQDPLIEIDIVIDSEGTGFRVDAEFATGVASPAVHASMPFDVVERVHEDNNLFGHDVGPELAAILMGQRETGHVTEFPFHDFVAMTDQSTTAAVLAQGIRSYSSAATGTIRVALRRSTEWLALSDLSLRSGDAGPRMYVPGARSERVITHRLGYVALAGDIESSGLFNTSESFHTPPTIATVTNGAVDGADSWHLFSAPVPVTSIFCDEAGRVLARIFNPFSTVQELASPIGERSPHGAELQEIDALRAKQIATVELVDHRPVEGVGDGQAAVHDAFADRGGRSRSMPEEAELSAMSDLIESLQGKLDQTLAEQAQASGTERYLLTHREYVLEREILELRLSVELNRRLLASTSEVSIPDAVDPVISELGVALNELRVKRRIYDYVAQALT